MSVERLSLYAEIETEHYAMIETYLKHLLQGHRWIEGQGSAPYQAERGVIDEVIAAARHRAEVVLGQMEKADAVRTQVSDGTVVRPDEAIMKLYRERAPTEAGRMARKARGRAHRH